MCDVRLETIVPLIICVVTNFVRFSVASVSQQPNVTCYDCVWWPAASHSDTFFGTEGCAAPINLTSEHIKTNCVFCTVYEGFIRDKPAASRVCVDQQKATFDYDFFTPPLNMSDHVCFDRPEAPTKLSSFFQKFNFTGVACACRDNHLCNGAPHQNNGVSLSRLALTILAPIFFVLSLTVH